MDNFEEILFKKLDALEAKVDEVRTQTLPAIKLDMAIMAERDRMHNKIFSGLTGIVAIIVSVFFSDVKR